MFSPNLRACRGQPVHAPSLYSVATISMPLPPWTTCSDATPKVVGRWNCFPPSLLVTRILHLMTILVRCFVSNGTGRIPGCWRQLQDDHLRPVWGTVTLTLWQMQQRYLNPCQQHSEIPQISQIQELLGQNVESVFKQDDAAAACPSISIETLVTIEIRIFFIVGHEIFFF